MGDLDLLLHMHAGGGIDDRLDVADVAAARRAFRHVDLAAVDHGRRHDQPDDLLVDAGRHVDRRGQRAGARHVEGRAVLEDAAGAPQREFVLLGEVAVDLDLRETPGIGAELPDPVLQQPLEITVVLLEMMLAEKQPFRPRYLAIP